MRGTAHLHFGAHKTGTTYCQFAIRENEARLRERGIAALWGRDRIIGKGALGNFVSTDGFSERLSQLVEELTAEQRCDSLIYSFEGSAGSMYSGKGDGPYPDYKTCLARFRDVLQARYATFKIYYGIRNQADFFASHYLQKVKEGHYHHFSGYIERRKRRNVSWVPMIEEMARLFGPENVEITNYSADRRLPGFSGLIDWDVVPIEHRNKNPSYDARGLKVALAVLPHLETKREKRALRKYIQKSLRYDPEDLPKLLTSEDREYFDEIYQRDLKNILAVGVQLIT